MHLGKKTYGIIYNRKVNKGKGAFGDCPFTFMWTNADTINWWLVLFFTFIDDYTRKIWVFFLKQKNEVYEHFCQYKTIVEKKVETTSKC